MFVPSCPSGDPCSWHWGSCRARLCPCCAPPPSTGGAPRGPGSIPVGPPGSFSQIRCVPPRPTPPSAPLCPSWCPPPIHPCAPLIPGAAGSGVGGLPGAPPRFRAGTPTPQPAAGMPWLRWARPDPGISGSVLEVGDRPSFHGGGTCSRLGGDVRPHVLTPKRPGLALRVGAGAWPQWDGAHAGSPLLGGILNLLGSEKSSKLIWPSRPPTH